jgi:hypothetical protein
VFEHPATLDQKMDVSIGDLPADDLRLIRSPSVKRLSWTNAALVPQAAMVQQAEIAAPALSLASVDRALLPGRVLAVPMAPWGLVSTFDQGIAIQPQTPVVHGAESTASCRLFTADDRTRWR